MTLLELTVRGVQHCPVDQVLQLCLSQLDSLFVEKPHSLDLAPLHLALDSVPDVGPGRALGHPQLHVVVGVTVLAYLDLEG